MFTFSANDMRALIARGLSDAEANGGYRNPHYGLSPGKDEKSGLWLVGDQGVYLMSNGKLAAGMRPMVCYAAECDSSTDPDWWHYKQRHFGGDDGIDFLDAAEVLRGIDGKTPPTHLRIAMTEYDMVLEPFRP